MLIPFILLYNNIISLINRGQARYEGQQKIICKIGFLPKISREENEQRIKKITVQLVRNFLNEEILKR